MSAFDDAADILEDQVYETYGKDATWNGKPCRVHFLDRGDQEERFGRNRSFDAGTVIEVRVREVDCAAKDDLVVVTDTKEVFRVIAEPQKKDSRRRRWTCEADRA